MDAQDFFDKKNMTHLKLKELYSIMFSEYTDIISVAEIQKMLGISRHLAYSLINDGYIPGVKIGNTLKVPKINVIQYVLGKQ